MPDFKARFSPGKTSRIFTKSVSCSQALMTVLDEAMGHVYEIGERAAHPLAGGLMHMGYQCGMLWGSTLAAGAEAVRRFGVGPTAEAAAIVAAQGILKSFREHWGNIDCRDITQSNFGTILGQIKYLLTGKAFSCTRMAVKWSPVALETIYGALDGLKGEGMNSGEPVSCASAVARKMGASEEEAAMTAGFAGGIGLSGGACGALGAATWVTALKWYKANPGVGESFAKSIRHTIAHNIDFNPLVSAKRLEFVKASKEKYSCSQIVGRSFESLQDHVDFLRGGGCKEIITALI